ncbi:MAG: type I DNA topoisomerase, partial [Candidatus Omnitrophica bacterium]|nr:type I DNA topoisomerase [Candidatus Omnitrophota bacterium]
KKLTKKKTTKKKVTKKKVTKKKTTKKTTSSKSKFLVIVESPTKAKTIYNILGDEYDVTSSMGHIVDLPTKRISVDVENEFEPHYRVIPGKEKIIALLKKKAKGKEIVYLATDPDREGEAISWHIKDVLSEVGKQFFRVTFHEITESALKDAIAHPGELDLKKIDAQTARRVLDRIVGYYLSPLLWKKIVRGLSAGRVQSIALKFVVDREKEISEFIPRTTYSIEAKLKDKDNIFAAKLTKYEGNKKLFFDNKEEALKCVEDLKKESFSVSGLAKKQTKRKPSPPHTTSLLQQDAYGRLRFSSQKTMYVAQKLYEGTDIKGKSVGLITYMRTDSFYVNPKAKTEAKEFIVARFGENYLPEKEHRYKEKKGAQRAHEAIRPTSIYRDPPNISNFISGDENRLYEVIWSRFIASLMKEAIFENSKMFLSSSLAEFTAEGKKLVFEGFLKVFGRSEEETPLPDLKKGDKVELLDFKIIEHTTKPPPHYNDASIVKLLEDKGIGRPSTYAPTISTLIFRNYVKREKGYFSPTDLGVKVSQLLTEHFPKIINEDFTALMEEKLDKVEEGEIDWKKILKDFFPSFKDSVEKASNLVKKEVVFSDKSCPKCKGSLVIKWSRKGKFLSCEHFPKCRYAESITTQVHCPDCKEGMLIRRRNKRGQFFYGCTKFPDCRYTSRNLPSEGETLKTKEDE